MSTRLHTQDPTKRLTYLGVRQRAIREHLLQRLTEKQYRRVALLYGFDGEPMSEREAAQAEGIVRRSLRDSVYLAIGKPVELDDGSEVRQGGKVSHDWCLWALWVVGNFFTPPNLYIAEGRGFSEAGNLRGTPSSPADPDALASAPDKFRYDKETEQAKPIRYPDEREVMHVDWQPEYRSVHSPRPGDKDAWETDRYHPESRYDRQVDELNEKHETGQITRIEWEVELLLAYVEDKNPKTSELDMDDLRQELEWVFGGQELGGYSEEKTQQLMSRALRPYVNSAR